MVFRLGVSVGGRHTAFALTRHKQGWQDYFLDDHALFSSVAPEVFIPAGSARDLFAFQLLPKLTETSFVNLALASGILGAALRWDWLTGKEVEKWAPATEADLPEQVQGLIAYRRAESSEVQALILGNLSVRWDLLADAAQGPLVWKAIAHQMGPQALRMNLNTLVRHGVFSNGTKESAMVDYVAGRIADAAEVRRSRQFPYQFLAAYLNADETVPHKIRAALHQAAEIACGNVPELPGPVLIGLDTSGSMGAAVTGRITGRKTSVRRIAVLCRGT